MPWDLNQVRQNRNAVLDARSAPRRGERAKRANQSHPLRHLSGSVRLKRQIEMKAGTAFFFANDTNLAFM
jgi:hypothetical protein